MLSLIQENLLIKYYRKMYADKLRDERNLFKQGANIILVNKQKSLTSFNFIQDKTILSFKVAGDLCLDEINKEKQKAIASMDFVDTNLQVNFYTEDQHEDTFGSCSCCSRSETLPTCEILFTRFSFPKLLATKLIINRHIKYFIDDAKFKFVRQPNGKDVKRFLENIEKVK